MISKNSVKRANIIAKFLFMVYNYKSVGGKRGEKSEKNFFGFSSGKKYPPAELK